MSLFNGETWQRLLGLFSDKSVKTKPTDKFYGLTPEEVVHNVLLERGFAPPTEASRFDYVFEANIAYHGVEVLSDRVYLKMYAKLNGHTDSGMIGPPLPNAKELKAFLSYEGYCDE